MQLLNAVRKNLLLGKISHQFIYCKIRWLWPVFFSFVSFFLSRLIRNVHKINVYKYIHIYLQAYLCNIVDACLKLAATFIIINYYYFLYFLYYVFFGICKSAENSLFRILFYLFFFIFLWILLSLSLAYTTCCCISENES